MQITCPLIDPTMSKKEIVDMLQSNSLQVTQGTYYKPLTDEEVSHRQQDFEIAIRSIWDINERKQAYLKVIKEEIEPLQSSAKQLSHEIKHRQVEQNGRLFHIVNNNDDTKADVYNENGEYLFTRQLTPTERKQQQLPFNGTLSIAQ